jgi:hypothetical protein
MECGAPGAAFTTILRLPINRSPSTKPFTLRAKSYKCTLEVLFDQQFPNDV